MRAITWRVGGQYLLPIIVMGVPALVPWLYSAAERERGDPDGVMLLLVFAIIPALALLIGFVLRPAHLWVAPLLGFVLLAFTAPSEQAYNADEKLYLFYFTAVHWLFWLWLGRRAHAWLDEHGPLIRRLRPPATT